MLCVAVCQDPVYGKGKLAEIQGLILGMLDTFNYEQVKHRLGVSILCIVVSYLYNIISMW